MAGQRAGGESELEGIFPVILRIKRIMFNMLTVILGGLCISATVLCISILLDNVSAPVPSNMEKEKEEISLTRRECEYLEAFRAYLDALTQNMDLKLAIYIIQGDFGELYNGKDVWRDKTFMQLVTRIDRYKVTENEMNSKWKADDKLAFLKVKLDEVNKENKLLAAELQRALKARSSKP